MTDHAQLGSEAYRAGQYAVAATHLASAVLRAPSDATLRLMWARSLERLDQNTLAAEQFRRVVAQASDAQLRAMAQASLQKLEAGTAGMLAELVSAGLLTAIEAEQVESQRGPAETHLTALLRLTPLRFEDLVTVRFGPHGLARMPQRPFAERLGSRLVAAKHLTQFQLKQALMAQANDDRALGHLVADSANVPEEAILAALQGHHPVTPQLSRHDQLAAVLHRWGVLSDTQLKDLSHAGNQLPALLLQRKWCEREHLTRVQTFLKLKANALAQRRFRLGEVMIESGVISREELAKLLACQIDQPYPLGDLMIQHRACSPEAVLDALAEQQRRYDAEAERNLPPLPEPKAEDLADLESEAPAKTDRRRTVAIAVGGTLLVAYAAWYGLRYGATNFSWFGMFTRSAAHAPRDQIPGVAPEVPGSSPPPAGPNGAVSDFDPLHDPANAAAQPPGPSPLPAANLDVHALNASLPSPPSVAAPTPLDPARSPAYAPAPLPMFTPPAAWSVPMGTPAARGSTLPGGAPARPALLMPEARRGQAGSPATLTPSGAPGTVDAVMGAGPRAQKLDAAGAAPRGTVPGSPGSLAAGNLDNAQVARSSAIFRYRLGQAAFGEGRWQSARGEFEAARELDPTSPLPYYYLARLAESAGDRRGAVSNYRTYLKGAPEGEFGRDAASRLAQLKP